MAGALARVLLANDAEAFLDPLKLPKRFPDTLYVQAEVQRQGESLWVGHKRCQVHEGYSMEKLNKCMWIFVTFSEFCVVHGWKGEEYSSTAGIQTTTCLCKITGETECVMERLQTKTTWPPADPHPQPLVCMIDEQQCVYDRKQQNRINDKVSVKKTAQRPADSRPPVVRLFLQCYCTSLAGGWVT